MRVENEPAYVLEARPYRETSLLVELFTHSHGRLAAVARGVRGEGRSQRLRRAALEPFQRLSVDVSGRGEVLSLGRFEPVSASLRPTGPALFSALYVNELVQKLTGRSDPIPAVFERYTAWLAELTGLCRAPLTLRESAPLYAIAETGVAANCAVPVVSAETDRSEAVDSEATEQRALALAWSLRRFERDLLAELGYALALDHCAEDGSGLDPEADYAFDPEHGALPWHVGSIWPRVRGATLLAWAGDALPEASTGRALKHLARSIVRHHLGGAELRAWRLAAQWQA